MPDMQIIVFSLNNETCGVETSQVQEIVKYQEVTKVPRMPKFIDGLISLRGRVVPVVNLNTRFDLGQTEITKKTKIVITTIDKNPVGFIVNDVSEILKLGEEDIEAAPDIVRSTGNSFFRSVGKKDGKLISIMNFESVLSDSEIKRLASSKFNK